MNGWRFTRTVVFTLLGLCAAGGAGAATMKVRVYGPAGYYTAFLHQDGNLSVFSAKTGGWGVVDSYGDFYFTVPSGHAYWAMATRLADNRSAVGSPSVYLWWPWSSGTTTVYLNNLALSPAPPVLQAVTPEGDVPPARASTGKVRTSWGRVKQLYHH